MSKKSKKETDDDIVVENEVNDKKKDKSKKTDKDIKSKKNKTTEPDLKGKAPKKSVKIDESSKIASASSSKQIEIDKNLPVEVINSENFKTDIKNNIMIDLHGKILDSYVNAYGFTSFLKEGYEHFITEELPRILYSKTISTQNGELVFRNIFIATPKIKPETARTGGLTYNLTLYVDIYFIETPKNKYTLNDTNSQNNNNNTSSLPVSASETKTSIPKNDDKEPEMTLITKSMELCNIPCMLGTKWSHYYEYNQYSEKKKEDALLKEGECIRDPGGYFIIKGAEKLVILQDKICTNRILVWQGDKKKIHKGVVPLTCRMTCPNKIGSIIVLLQEDQIGNITLNLPFFGKSKTGSESCKPTHLNVVNVLRYLGTILDTETGTNRYSSLSFIRQTILSFTSSDREKRLRCANKLNASFLVSSVGDNADDNAYFYNKLNLKETDPKINRSYLMGKFGAELFPQIESTDIRTKFYQLCLSVAKIIECSAGVRAIDNRDYWENRRVVDAAASIAQLFGSLINTYVSKVERETISHATYNPVAIVQNIMMPNKKIINDNFVSSFHTNKWGIKTQWTKESITDILNRLTLPASIAHLRRINTSTSRKIKQGTLRHVQMDQWGFISPEETPEGANCGLLKTLALTAKISLERDQNLIYDELVKYKLIGSRNEERTVKFILNGIFYGWCNGLDTKNFAITMRRTRRGPIDMSVQYDVRNNNLSIYCDSGRLIRPVLIVGDGIAPLINKDGSTMVDKKGKPILTEANKPVIEQLNLFDAPFDELLTRQCVEFIDVQEQSFLKIALNIEDISLGKDNLDAAREKYERSTSLLADLKAGKKLVNEVEKDVSLEGFAQSTNDYERLTEEQAYSYIMDQQESMAYSQALIRLQTEYPGLQDCCWAQIWNPSLIAPGFKVFDYKGDITRVEDNSVGSKNKDRANMSSSVTTSVGKNGPKIRRIINTSTLKDVESKSDIYKKLLEPEVPIEDDFDIEF